MTGLPSTKGPLFTTKSRITQRIHAANAVDEKIINSDLKQNSPTLPQEGLIP